ncbi:Hok/Gef family protein [Erwinia tracheiphila]|uniref:Hok/Gef family protein n=1 Tax=Erwinia tracheiphila TaxID=65700 RepID=A0A345CPP9_9GAMM|nr:Hok/Gef family protein [Erwinia tracheiphila]AXF76073.1 Hok/Gef family protein [Erwinia tracheiphila]
MNPTIQMLASYQPKGKELTMKQQTAILIATIVIAAAVAVILVTRKDLCEVRIRTSHAEVAAFMDYEPK